MTILKKLTKIKKSYLFSISLLVVVIGWFSINQIIRTPKTNKINTSTILATPRVSILNIQPIQTNREVLIYGNIESTKKVDLIPRAGGIIKNISAKSGSRLKAGDTILSIDIDTREDEVKQAKATLEHTKSEYEAIKKLATKGYATTTTVAKNKAAYESALANYERYKLELANTVIKAPFDGFLDKVSIDVGDIVLANTTVLGTYIDDKSFVASGYISQRDRNYIQENQEAIIKMSNTSYDEDLEFTTKVTFVSKVADKSTRTYRIEFEIPSAYLQFMLHGQIVEISVKADDIAAYKIPSAVLNLNEKGSLGVKIATTENKVKFEEITILKEKGNYMEVLLKNNTNTTDSIDIIVLGQTYVKEGSKIQTKRITDNFLN